MSSAIRSKSPYYVSEKELWTDVLVLYETDEFPERLAKNVLKMAQRIVNAKRWDSCSDALRQEMVSRSAAHCCLKLLEKKYDPKKGSKAYSWISRVLINECLKTIEEEQATKKKFQTYAEFYALHFPVERINRYEIDDN